MVYSTKHPYLFQVLLHYIDILLQLFAKHDPKWFYEKCLLKALSPNVCDYLLFSAQVGMYSQWDREFATISRTAFNCKLLHKLFENRVFELKTKLLFKTKSCFKHTKRIAEMQKIHMIFFEAEKKFIVNLYYFRSNGKNEPQKIARKIYFHVRKFNEYTTNGLIHAILNLRRPTINSFSTSSRN